MATSTSGTPGRPGLTFEQYEAAYQELSSPEGEPPSQRQIRRYLGTGSNSTLSAYRRRIAEQRSEQTIAPEQGSLDEKLLVSVTQLVSQLNLEASQIADDRVDEIQAEADHRIHIAETTMEKRLQDTALLEHRANTAETMIKEQRTALTAKDEKLHKLEADLQSSRELGATMTQSLEDMTRQLATKAREADALEQAMELSRSASKTAADQLQIEIDSVKNTLGQSQAALATVTEQCAGLSSRLEDRDKLVDSQLVQQHELQLRLERSEESYRTTLTQLENMRQSVSELNAQLSVRDAELSAEKRAHEVCSERLESTSMIVEKNEALTIQLQKALKELLAAKKHSS